MLKVIRPSIWIGIIATLWGAVSITPDLDKQPLICNQVMLGQGFVQNYHQLIATRVLLGVMEAGFFPAASFLTTIWYCRFELQTRLAIFYTAASMAGAFSGLLAFGIEHMDGIGGLAGWRWIFILEGLLTIVAGLLVPFILPDSPVTARFLSAEEKAMILLRMEQDSGTSSGKVETAEKFQWKFVWAALLDWKIWFAIFIFWGNT